MDIRNPDGTPYQLKGCFQTFDPNSKVHDLFNRYDQEAIRIGGSPIYYYEVIIQFQTLDELYLEDRGKLYSPVYVPLYVIYEPPQQQAMSGLFLVDVPADEVIFELNYKATLQAVGHLPKVGSRIYTPHLQENWKIIDRKFDQFKAWGALRLLLHCRKFQETLTTGEGQVTQAKPDFDLAKPS